MSEDHVSATVTQYSPIKEGFNLLGGEKIGEHDEG